jgi:hypothetical protein
VDNTNADFVGTRNYNLSSNPANIRLSRLAQWDYTALYGSSYGTAVTAYATIGGELQQ